MTATRRTAREWAIQMLTAADLNPPDDVQAFMNGYWDQISDLDEEDGGPAEAKGKLKQFAEERVAGVLGSLKQLDDILVRFSTTGISTASARSNARFSAWACGN